MKYLELIPILLFVLMIITDRKHLGKLSQSVKDFEENNSGVTITRSHLNFETAQMLEYNEGEQVDDANMFITSAFKSDRDSTKPSVIIEVASPDFSW